MKSDTGAIVRLIRKHKKISAKMLAKTAGIDPAHLSRFESGEVSIRLDKLEAVCAALGVPSWKVVFAGEIYTEKVSPILRKIIATFDGEEP